MSKLDFKRVFLKDDGDKYYRIFSVANGEDYTGERYVKLVFPDIVGVPLITGEHNKEGIVTNRDILPGGVNEFSYHYRSGISHLKSFDEYIDSKRNIPTLLDKPALHLVRFVVRSLKIFKEQRLSKITENDFVLPLVFDGRARGFELSISRISGPWKVINTQGDDPVQTYKLALNDPNVSFHIADCLWNRPPIVPGEPLFEIFRYDDPTNNLEFKPFKSDA